MFYSSRSFCSIIYDRDVLEKLIEHLKLADGGEYAYILHYADVNDDGSPSKPHYHLYGRRRSPITNETFKNFRKLVDSNILWSNVKNPVSAIRYLTHKDDMNKYQYKDSEVESNFDYVSACNKDMGQCRRVDNVEVISKLDAGWSVISIIRQNPNLLYSINQLKAYRELLLEEKRVKEKTAWCEDAVSSNIIQLPVADA